VDHELLATNKHVLAPWVDDQRALEFLKIKGNKPSVSDMFAVFPNQATITKLHDPIFSDKADAAVVMFNALGNDFISLPIADEPAKLAEHVIVVGYPASLQFIADTSSKSTPIKSDQFSNGAEQVKEFASHKFINPAVTYGRIGRVDGDKITYDAVTTYGASGSPVFRSFDGKVIGINTALPTYFNVVTIGTSVNVIVPLIKVAENRRMSVENNNGEK